MQKQTFVISFLKFISNSKIIYLEFCGSMTDAIELLGQCYPDATIISSETEFSNFPLVSGKYSFTGEPYLSTKSKTPPLMERKKMMWLVYGSLLMGIVLFIAIVCIAIAFKFIFWLFGGILFLFVVVVGLLYGSKRRAKK